jgi:hypothetical protein
MQIRPLDASDAIALASFRCGGTGPWDREVQHGINDYLAEELRKETNLALGAWDGDNLAGVIAWRRYGGDWKITLVAVAMPYRGQHLAEQLKERVCELAAQDQVRLVFSAVHRDNTTMAHINEKMKAGRDRDPHRPDYWLYVLDVGRYLTTRPAAETPDVGQQPGPWD